MTAFKGALLGGLLFLVSFNSMAQRYARASGAWNTAIWASTPGGIAGSAATPTATDDVYTNGFQISSSSSISCKDLFIDSNFGSPSIVLSSFATLTVNGTLTGWDGSGDAVPIPNCITFSGTSRLRLTGTNITGLNYAPDYVVYAFDDTSPIGRLVFDFGTGVTRRIIAPLNVTTTLTLTSGTLVPDGGAFIQLGASGSMVISSGSTLITNDPIHGGSSSLLFNSLSITGTLTTSSYVNSTNISFNSGGTLNTSYSGTEGWWFGSNRPTGGPPIDPNFTVNYSASSNQNIYTTTYGNLTLGGVSTKSAFGGGSLNILGNLTFSNASTVLSCSQAVIFNGSSAQSISGGGTANFNGGLQVNKSAGTLTISQNLTVQNGLTISSGTLDLGSNNVNLSGNLSVSGSLVASASTLTITGSSAITTGSPNLNNLTISGTGSFTAPSAFSIAGNFSNSGSFNANNGTITFNGTNAQSISGTSTLTNINCNTTSGGSVSINGNVSLNGVLTLSSSGIFDADGAGSGVFTVASLDQNSGGRIATLPNPGNFSGLVTVQRFIHSQTGGDYRYLSMPVTTNQNNLSRWKAAIGVTGAFSDRSVNSEFANIQDSGNTNPSVFTWNGTAYVAVTGGSTASTTLSSRTGYVAYNYNNGSVTASYRGDIETGSVPISISNVNGNFNLIPNPYPSPIDFDLISKSTINDALWLRTGNNTFSTYAGGVAAGDVVFGGWAGEIAIGQSFWTQSNGVGSSLTLTESAKTNGSVRFLRTEKPINYVRIKLSGADQWDDAVLRFADDATDDLAGNYDAVKRKNGNYVSALGQNTYLNLSLYIVSPSIDYAIKGIAPLSQTETVRVVPLKVADAKNGNYTFKFTELSSFDLGYKIFLKDKFLSKEVEIAENEEYEFSITSNASTTGSARFELVFRKDIVTALEPTLSQEVLVYPNPVSSDGRLTIVIPEQLGEPIISIFLYDMKGSVIYSSENDKKILEPGVKTIEMGQAGTGLYILNITSGKQIKSIRVLKR